MTTLEDYLDAAARRPWRWGGTNGMDCCCFGAGWVQAAIGLDPMAVLRTRYASAGTARRLIVKAGGLLPLVAGEMEALGLKRSDVPDHGDIGVIPLPKSDDEHAVAGAAVAVRFNRWWIARTLTGLQGFDGVPVLASWRVI